MHENHEDAVEWLDTKAASQRFNVSVVRLLELAYLETSPLEVKYETFGKIRQKLLISVPSLKAWNRTRRERYRAEELETERSGRTEPDAALLIGV